MQYEWKKWKIDTRSLLVTGWLIYGNNMQYEWKNMENDDHPSVLLRHLLKFLKFSKATAASHPPELLYPLGFGYHTSTPVTTKKSLGLAVDRCHTMWKPQNPVISSLFYNKTISDHTSFAPKVFQQTQMPRVPSVSALVSWLPSRLPIALVVRVSGSNPTR